MLGGWRMLRRRRPPSELCEDFLCGEHSRPKPTQHGQGGFLHLVAVRSGGITRNNNPVL